MAEVSEQEAQFLATLETLESDPDAVDAEEAADQEDVSLSKIARQTDRKVEAFITEQKIDKKVEKFLSSASPEAQELFAIYRTGDETEKQLDRIMQLSITKSSEARKGDDADTEESPEDKARKIAADQYGVGPISGGASATTERPEEVFDSLAAAGRKGDSHASFLLWNGLPSNGERSEE
jgi:hypothetical protein